MESPLPNRFEICRWEQDRGRNMASILPDALPTTSTVTP